MAQEGNTERRTERIVFETDRQRVVGDMTLPATGYQSRFSDSLNRSEFAFVPLTEVEVTELTGGEVSKRDFVVVAKAHVRYAYPLDQAG
jgi:hypothetical protein